jgi:selT/selW/selH-like putative selenoprotein
LAAEIKKAKGLDATTVPGARGAFEVFRDGVLVYSKLKTGRFPTSEQEVVDLL